jgi:hypothetical protein
MILYLGVKCKKSIDGLFTKRSSYQTFFFYILSLICTNVYTEHFLNGLFYLEN